MPSRMLYNASAACASGRLTLPVQETMPTQAPVSLQRIGGVGSASVEEYTYRNIVYMEYAESSVVGSYSEKDKAHGTASMAIIEGLNVMDVVTCDRIVARITTKHPQSAEPSIIPMGSVIEGLRVAGHPMRPVLSVILFTQYDTWTQLNNAYKNDQAVKKQLDDQSFYKGTGKDLPEAKGIYGCTLVSDWGP